MNHISIDQNPYKTDQPPVLELQDFVQNMFMGPFTKLGKIFNMNRAFDMRLIFRLVYNQCRCKKTFERLWISSMEDAAIREGIRDLKPGTAYDNLYAAALCRERADWIVGMNAPGFFVSQ